MQNKSKHNYQNTTKGWVEIADKKYYFKSKWEANMAAYFQFLKEVGEISDWEYETETFWFENIKRGVRSYTPDFKITDKDGSIYFEEVKGYMDAKSATKLKRMAKYYPNVSLRLLDKTRYTQISKSKSMIKHWGKLD